MTLPDSEISPDTGEINDRELLKSILPCFLISGAAAQPLGSFIPYLRESYSLSYGVSGILLSCQSIGNFTAMILAGILPVYIGRRKSAVFMASWMAVGYLIFVLGLGSPFILIPAFFMTGISRGGNSTFCNTMISTLPGQKAQRGFNLGHGSFSLGAFISPILLIIFGLLFPEYGWRIVAGIILLLILRQIYTFSTMYIPPERKENPSGKGTRKFDFSYCRSVTFWTSGAVLLSYLAVEYSLSGWIVTYFQDTGLLSDNMAQFMNSLFFLCMFAGRMLGSYLTGKISRKSVLIADGICVAVFLTLLIRATSTSQVVIGVIGSSLSCATIFPTGYSIGAEIVRGNDTGCSTLMLLSSIGGIIAPAAIGAVAEKNGISAGMNVIFVFAAFMIVSIAVCVLQISRRPSGSSADC